MTDRIGTVSNHSPQSNKHYAAAMAIWVKPGAPRMPGRTKPSVAQFGFGTTMIRALLRTLRTWRTRIRGRADLLALDDRMLRDIGLTRVDARRQASKPFWRA